MGKRTFGSSRQLPFRRWQARYLKDGIQYVGPTTFEAKADADAYLSEVQTEIRKQVWIDPDAGAITFREYAEKWHADRLDLRPTTRGLYKILLDKWLLPHLGDVSLAAMTPELWRRWHVKVSASKPGSLQPAKAYRLAHTILKSAVEDRRIVLNPCVVRGAAKEESPERPVADVKTITAIADAIAPHYRVLVMVGADASLRFGEATALRRRSVNLLHKTITVVDQALEVAPGSFEFGPPKTDAGIRTVAIDEDTANAVRDHLDAYVASDPDALLARAVAADDVLRGV